MTQYLTRAEAAEYVQARGLPCAKSTLAKLATVGGGPRYQRFGSRVVYTRDALDEWMACRMSGPVESTSALRG